MECLEYQGEGLGFSLIATSNRTVASLAQGGSEEGDVCQAVTGLVLAPPSAISCVGVCARVRVFETGFLTEPYVALHQFACWPVSLKNLLSPLHCWDDVGVGI